MPAVTTAIQKPGSIPLVSNLLTNTGRSAMSGIRLSNLQTSLRIQGSWNMVKCYWSIMISCWDFCTYLQTQAAQHPLNLLQLWSMLPNLINLPVRNLIGHLATTHCIWRQSCDKVKVNTEIVLLSYTLSQTTCSCHVWLDWSCTDCITWPLTSPGTCRHLVLLLLLLSMYWHHIGRHFHSFLISSLSKALA